MNKVVHNFFAMENHYNRLREMFVVSTDLIIASPFLMRDFSSFLSDVDLSKVKTFTVITTLKPKNMDQINKIDCFVSLIDFLRKYYPHIKLSLNINNKLHGKIYIFCNNDQFIGGIVTSANFTDNGLSHNHEWGIEITDQTVLTDLRNSLYGSIEYKDLSEDIVLEMLLKVETYLKEHNKIPQEIDLNLNKLLPDKQNIYFGSEQKKYWLKPVGVSEEPVLVGKSYSDMILLIDFSKRRPAGVEVGDILILYGVGQSKLLTVVEVLTEPQLATEEEIKNGLRRERWPWSVNTKNISPNYGDNWWLYDLKITKLVNEFLDLNEDGSITYVGSKSIGSLQYGSDKLRLSEDFAKFLINKVKELNKEVRRING